MKNQITMIAALALTLLTSSHVLAESLKCTETHTFRQANMFINRDGAIGFNGTLIQLDASWFRPGFFKTLGQLTGRASDQSLSPDALSLYLSPKGICTQNNDSLSEDFSCAGQQIEIDAKGKDLKQVSDGSIVKSEYISKNIRMIVDVDLKAHVQVVSSTQRNIHMVASIKNAKTGSEIKLDENMECEVQK